MAGYALIDSYLDDVSRRLSYRSDAADLRDELADHLLESADRATAAGLDPESAQRVTLDRFGDPRSVAALLAAVPTKGIDMVHTLGRSAGILSLVASALWVAAIFGGTFGLANALDTSWSTTEYFWQSLVQGLAVLVTATTLVALNLRIAGRIDGLTGVVIVGGLLASLASFLFAWAFLGWGVYLAGALAVTFGRTRQPAARGVVQALLFIAVPMLLVVGSFVGVQLLASEGLQPPLSSLQQQRLDLGLFAAEGVVCLLLAAGFAVLGVRLRNAESLVTEPTAFA